jgi:hypothetical protein
MDTYMLPPSARLTYAGYVKLQVTLGQDVSRRPTAEPQLFWWRLPFFGPMTFTFQVRLLQP